MMRLFLKVTPEPDFGNISNSNALSLSEKAE
jgi:hypothetical protein